MTNASCATIVLNLQRLDLVRHLGRLFDGRRSNSQHERARRFVRP